MHGIARGGVVALALAAILPATKLAAQQHSPPLSPAFAAMNGPMAPFRIADRLYYVGASGVSAYLIDTGAGLILLDGGFEVTAPQILANVRTLGFDPKNIKYLLNSQAHTDHAGGLAAIKQASGAMMLASREDAATLERGGLNDVHFGDDLPFPPVKVDRIIRNGERLRLGRVALTAHLTPGHTKGCTTWTMPVTDDRRTYTAQFNCGTTAPGYRLLGTPGYPNMVADFEATFAKLKTLPCDIPLTGHGMQFDLDTKRAALAKGAKPNPFVDPPGCREMLAKSEASFRAQLAQERNSKAP